MSKSGPKVDYELPTMDPEEWVNGNYYAPLTTMLGLRRIDDWNFRSTYPGYSPGGFTRAYGGHVYAQAALAGARTVRSGFVMHSVTGHFLLLGATDVPFDYEVAVVRDGGGYCQRRVDARQTDDVETRLVFTCMVSFKRSEKNVHLRSLKERLDDKYKSALSGVPVESMPECPGVDSPFWWTIEENRGVDPFPGLDMRKTDMDKYNDGKETLAKRQLQYYRVRGEMPSVEDDPNLHAAGHLYASDRNGLFAVPNYLGLGDDYNGMASLSHTVVFHGEFSTLSLTDGKGQPKWFCVEGAMKHISYGRCLLMTRLWDTTDKTHVGSTMQDGLIRMRSAEDEETPKIVFTTPSSKALPELGKANL